MKNKITITLDPEVIKMARQYTEYCDDCPLRQKALEGNCTVCVKLVKQKLEDDGIGEDLSFERVEFACHKMSNYWDKNDMRAWQEALDEF